MTVDLGSNRIVGVQDTLNTSIFINGNLARVLLASHKLKPNATLAAEAFRWCDTFVNTQHTADCVTHDGAAACGWWDTGYNTLYLADTGTAVTTLALCYEAARKPAYLRALTLFQAFVARGSRRTPQCVPTPGYKPVAECSYDGGQNETAPGFVIATGDDAGALGDGYYKGAINTAPYTIATALAGGVFHAELAGLFSGPAPPPPPAPAAVGGYLAIAERATRWLLRKIDPANGTIPYVITPRTAVDHTYQCISYSAESFVDLALRHGGARNASAVPELGALRPTVEYLLAKAASNTSGALLPAATGVTQGEVLRSARAASLLQWWYAAAAPAERDARIPRALEAYLVRWLGSAAGAAEEGVCRYATSTGFVGLVLADMIGEGSWPTFVA
eukprot:g6044.t1